MSSVIPAEGMRKLTEAGVTKTEIEKYSLLFKKFDEDSSGALDVEEMLTVLRSYGANPTEKEVKAIFDKFDTSHNGKVDVVEFILGTKELVKSREQEIGDLRKAFAKFDKDRRGYISSSELSQLMQHMGEEKLSDEELKDLFSIMDIDKDGRISYDEFILAVTGDFEDTY